MLPSKMLGNMGALLKTGQENSMQQFGLTSQVTEEKPKFMGRPYRNPHGLLSFFSLQCYPTKFKAFKTEFFRETYSAMNS